MRCKLGDISEITKLAGYEFTKYIKYIPDGEIIAVRALNLKNGALVLDDIQRISKEVSETLPRSQLHKNDIVLSYTGTLGECAQIREDGKYHLAPNVCKITPNDSVVNPNFLFQYIRCEKFKQTLINYAHGSTQPTIPMSTIRDIPVDIPDDLEKQGKIAAILSILDEKIAINRAINDNLEQQAQAVFRQELLQNGELPPNWTTGSLLDIADYLNGLAMQKFRPVDGERGLPVLKIKELRQGFCDYSSELCSPNIKPEFIVHDGDVIFSWSGSLLVDLWCGGTCGLNQHLFKVTSVKYPKWFYYTWTAHHLARFVAIAADKATTMGHIKREDLAKAEVIIPDVASMERIGGVLQPIYNLVINQRIENRKLSMLRDSLLPKLMSGELDVSSIEL